MNEPRVAIVHDYMNEYGGAGRVLDAMHEVFPEATVFTSLYKKEAFPGSENWNIKTSNINKMPLFEKLSKQYTFLYPLVFEAFDLREFDIVISSSSAWSKGVITNPKQLHIGYIHTPPRFLYKFAGESAKRDAWYYKPFVMVIDSFLRIWDFAAAKRPDFLVANSETVKKRIAKFYKRDSTVIYPPVNLAQKLVLPEEASKFETGYYLSVGRLSKYKNIDLIIEAFNVLGLPLRIVGTGKEEENLKSIAKGNIAFLGGVPDKDLPLLYENCKGVVFAVEDEDFGIVPVEALSYGKPVLAFRRGGPTEYIEDGKTGMFFDSLDAKSLGDAVLKFDKAVDSGTFDAVYIRNSVQKFGVERFKKEFREFVMSKWNEKIK